MSIEGGRFQGNDARLGKRCLWVESSIVAVRERQDQKENSRIVVKDAEMLIKLFICAVLATATSLVSAADEAKERESRNRLVECYKQTSAAPEAQAYFAKRGTTIEKLADKNKITDEERVAMSYVLEKNDLCRAQREKESRDAGYSGLSEDARNYFLDMKQLAVKLYNSEISWGQYNQAAVERQRIRRAEGDKARAAAEQESNQLFLQLLEMQNRNSARARTRREQSAPAPQQNTDCSSVVRGNTVQTDCITR